jgi:hypothetical protein
MPAINVARTDTFENQRVKINQLGNQVFDITQGGSDLATGNLKLGDGTRTAPSLAFTSDPTLGIFKPDEQTFGFVSSGKKIADFAPTGFFSFKDVILQQKTIPNSGISILNYGNNYDSGSYTNIALTGGSGEFATANIDITEFSGTVTNTGKNYVVGTYSNILLNGGTGTDAAVNFAVDTLLGDILNAGSGYIPGTYTNVSLTGGTGSGAVATITTTGDTILSGSITNSGTGYNPGQLQNILAFNTPRQTFVVTSTANPGSPPPNNVYVIDSVIQDTLTLEKGNTYRFDVSDSSVLTHPFNFLDVLDQQLDQDYYNISTIGNQGNAGAYVYLVISPDAPTETIKYICAAHSGMGANINIVAGTPGIYGSRIRVNATVEANGTISSITFVDNGSNYKVNDTFTIFDANGSGFVYVVGGVSYTGVVTNVNVTDIGLNYEIGDILSFSNSFVNGVGSGFQFSISSNPGKISNFTFVSKGSGYVLNDALTLPVSISGVSGNVNGEVVGLSTTLSTASTTITVADTTGIIVGMVVTILQGSIGELPQSTVTVVSVDSATQITISDNPTTDGSTSLRFASVGNFDQIVLTSTAGIIVGSSVQKSSGSGIIDASTTVISVDSDANTITVSPNPTQAGPISLDFTPPFGIGDGLFGYQIEKLGTVDSFTISAGGNGYAVGDELSVSPFDLTIPIVYTVGSLSVQKLTLATPVATGTFTIGNTVKIRDGGVSVFTPGNYPVITQTIISNIATTLNDATAAITVADTTGISVGMVVSQGQSDTGALGAGGNSQVLSVDSATELTLSEIPSISGAATLTFTSDESGNFFAVASTTDSTNGTGATFNVIRSSDGGVSNVSVGSVGYFYEENDTITIAGSLVGGTSPTHDITITLGSTIQSEDVEIYDLQISGSNIITLLVGTPAIEFVDNDVIIKTGTTNSFPISTSATPVFKFTIDSGSGAELTPDLTLYSGNTYNFNVSAISSSHEFAFSSFAGGNRAPSFIENISTTLDNLSDTITVTSTTGILEGMGVSVTSGSGVILANTTVKSVVNSTTVQLSVNPQVSGPVVLSFIGVEYTDNVTKSSSNIAIRITDSTPNLYYYCNQVGSEHSEEGKSFTGSALATVDTNNPKIFGSELSVSVAELISSDNITMDILDGSINCLDVISTDGTFSSANITTLTSTSISSNTITVSSINASGPISVTSTSVNISGSLNVGSNFQVETSNGNLTTSGVLKTNNSLNVNDYLEITNNVISSTSGHDVLLTPSTGRVAKVNTTTALIIPAGTSAERPTGGIVANGAVRFNTDSGQYEGYNASNTSWSSLGGVRDLDGNTYIEAESSVGANDNTLYFYNDGNNTVSVTPNYLQFVNVKKIRSINTTAPTYTDYATNTNVTLGDYLKYRNNIYEVTQTGQTATSGNEPVHTTGAVSNGTAELTWHSTAVSSLIFEEIDEIKIDPLGFTDLVVNGELRFSNNVISTDLQDLIVRPNTGKKVTVDSNTSLVLPVGDINQRGVAAQGSVRFNTTNSTYEGYDGTNWGSLGGVKDVDQNTYIIPELSAGSDENILYFYNNGTNTMRLSEAALDFTNIDTITSQNNNLDLQAQTVTFNSLAATIDTSGNSTFISTTKDNLDLGLAVGINVDPILRLDTNGDIYGNKAFGTGSFDGLKLISSSFDSFELIDYRINTQDIQLIKGGTNSGAAALYNPTADTGSRVTVSIHNQTSGDKEMIEYHVIDKGSDIHHTDISNLNTGTNLVNSVFDFDAQNNVRVTFTLTDLAVGDVVNITVVSNTFKK